MRLTFLIAVGFFVLLAGSPGRAVGAENRGTQFMPAERTSSPVNHICFSQYLPPPYQQTEVCARSSQDGSILMDLHIRLGEANIVLPDNIRVRIRQPWLDTITLTYSTAKPTDPQWFGLDPVPWTVNDLGPKHCLTTFCSRN